MEIVRMLDWLTEHKNMIIGIVGIGLVIVGLWFLYDIMRLWKVI